MSDHPGESVIVSSFLRSSCHLFPWVVTILGMVTVPGVVTVQMIMTILWMMNILVNWSHQYHCSHITQYCEISLKKVGDHPWKMDDHPVEVGDPNGVESCQKYKCIVAIR